MLCNFILIDLAVWRSDVRRPLLPRRPHLQEIRALQLGGQRELLGKSKIILYIIYYIYYIYIIYILITFFQCFLLQNYRRVAEVWMDEYKQYIYKRRPFYKDIDMGKHFPTKNLLLLKKNL